MAEDRFAGKHNQNTVEYRTFIMLFPLHETHETLRISLVTDYTVVADFLVRYRLTHTAV